jgi:hypothetical protein
MSATPQANTVRFHTLGIYAPHDEGEDLSQPLDAVLEKAKSGYHAFYGHNSAVMVRGTSAASELKNFFFNYLSDQSSSAAIDPSQQVDEWKPEAGKLYFPGGSLPKDYAEKTCRFLRQLRELLAAGTGGFKEKPAFALNQASVFDLVGDRREQSALIANTLGYHEYLLWDDGGLWEQDNWRKQHGESIAAYKASKFYKGEGVLCRSTSTSPDDIDLDTWAEQRMAWIGAGWPSQSLARWCGKTGVAWPVLSEFSTMANAAVERLERYDLALAEYYRKAETRDPPGYKPWNTYVRLLCNFLPDHRSRSNPGKWLGSNTLGDDGGPRLWRGILDDRLNMHLVHLLLEGWLTLWPVEKDGRTELYLQPGSLALLYWAAQRADMPWANTPQNFLEHYDWSDPNWFGACREYWKPIR